MRAPGAVRAVKDEDHNRPGNQEIVMSLLRSTTVVAALLALGAASVAAQSRAPSSIWSIPDRDGRWDSRNGDSDSDSDWDSDSDSDSDSEWRSRSRRGSIFDRIDPRRRTDDRRRTSDRQRDTRLEREIARAHDEWHRRNDRARRDNAWERRHRAMHAELERVRRQQSRSRSPGRIIR